MLCKALSLRRPGESPWLPKRNGDSQKRLQLNTEHRTEPMQPKLLGPCQGAVWLHGSPGALRRARAELLELTRLVICYLRELSGHPSM